MEWIAAVNGVLTVLGSASVFLVPWLARQLSGKVAQVQQAEATAGKIAEGLKYVEAAVASNKTGDSSAGAAVTNTIAAYGPVAVAAVDKARDLAHQIQEDIWKQQEDALIARERQQHQSELLERSATAQEAAAQAAQTTTMATTTGTAPDPAPEATAEATATAASADAK
jgi:hypothetical protein